jgi:transcriptional regulator with GAF, ATPase, and Fis domain/Tfp pilus assembly protein PilF
LTTDKHHSTSAVVDLQDARARLNSAPGKATPDSLAADLTAVRDLLDQGLSADARKLLNAILSTARGHRSLLAEARLSLSIALEMQGQFRESLDALSMYEDPDMRAKLDFELSSKIQIQIALAYNYNRDQPKSISLLKATLRELPEQGATTGAAYATLARVYRTLTEFPIARGYSQQALDCYRQTGDWRGLAETYFGLAIADIQEGKHEAALQNFSQTIQLVGDRPASYLLGRTYSNMAGACYFLKRPQDGIRYLEKAIAYYERTDHKASAAEAYNNLGINLVLIGQWDRAQAALEKALSIAHDVDGPEQPMIMDSLGELLMLRGELDEARTLLERAVGLATEKGHNWYRCQTHRTLGRCCLAMGQTESALAQAKSALTLAELVGDRQAICESRLLLGETSLQAHMIADVEGALLKLDELITDSETDFLLAGETQRLHGLLEMQQHEAALAAQHFGRSVSIFNLLGDRYRSARAHYDLGRAYAIAQPQDAAEEFARAIDVFRELGAQLDLTRAEDATAALDQTAFEQSRHGETVAQLLTLRLAEAVASRELLLHELAAVIRQESRCESIAILEADSTTSKSVVVNHGFDETTVLNLAHSPGKLDTDRQLKQLTEQSDVAVIPLKPTNAPSATLLISPRQAAQLRAGLSLDPLLRIAELGMDLCALRERNRTNQSGAEESDLASTNLMPGFIHSSPAMTRLVDEVHKIRSSNVTVLVTGESGTGKELVSRAIHALSSRREKIFVPFNCTAVPKELTEGYLFGYRRGAFTGAVKDSGGVIRAAAGGTLFLDEVGDLPIDVQPKLLRFLQEGEIQPLGEQRPIKVDVRIIAATNNDLEEMVAQGRFREDLYYRLNVIRLRVPPLRERRSEIPAIVNYYANHYSAKFGRQDIQIAPQAIDFLMVAEWPGNVRQLCNEVQRLIARAEDGIVISPEHLSPELRRLSSPAAPAAITPVSRSGATATVPLQNLTLAEALAEVERRMIAAALRKHNGNISRAARELGLTRRGLYLKLDRLEMTASA